MKTMTAENIKIERKEEMSTAEICFGAMMAIASIAGIWGAVSILISLFVGG